MVQPLEVKHSENVVMRKTQWGRVDLNVDTAAGDFQYLNEIVKTLASEDLFCAMGLHAYQRR